MITIPAGQTLIALDSAGRKSVLTITTDIKIDITAHHDNRIGVKHEIPPDRSGTVLDGFRVVATGGMTDGPTITAPGGFQGK